MKFLQKSIITVTLSFFIFNNATGQNVYPGFVDGEIFVKVKDTSDTVLTLTLPDPAYQNIITNYGVWNINNPFFVSDSAVNNSVFQRTYKHYFTDSLNVDILISQLEQLSYIEYAERVPLVTTVHIPNDPKLIDQYYITKINAEGAWDFSTGDAGVVVGIVDNGVLIDHEDLSANIWQNEEEVNGIDGIDDDLNGFIDDYYGWDFSDNDNNPSPPDSGLTFSHGTHVAGVASGATNNSTGVASVGYNTSIMAIKAAPNSSDGRHLDKVYEGVLYAADNGADVINMSFGGNQSAKTHRNVIQYAHDQGAVLIGAAGNSDTTAKFYPASYDNVIGVGATNELDQKAGFSNYGGSIDVMAPGTNILSTLARNTSDYGKLGGTSMATPVVAGIALLLLSYDNSLTPGEVELLIEKGAENIDAVNPAYIGQLGAGRVNAYRSFVELTGDTTINNLLTPDHDVRIYPNPASNKMNIIFPESGDKNITLMQVNGQLIRKEQFSGKEKEIDISDLTDGIYLLKIVGEKKTDVVKLFVLK